MNDKKAWADEPTPLTTAEIEKHDGEDSFQHYIDFAAELEKRLRHAWKLVNSLRIDCMHGAHGDDWQLDPELLEQQLANIEETLQ